jgi:pimeloyl-ACP methyl ester carboxylesterase
MLYRGRQMSQADASVPVPDAPSAESTFYEVNDVRLHVVAAGDPDDPLVVLLHGFPEFWYGWREYVEPLVDAGYRVLVPDQRGYNRSEKPDGTRAYRPAELAADVTSLVAADGRDTAHLVGHDWGAAVAWNVALRSPEVVDRLGILNVPHPTVFEDRLTSSLTQMRKSWYMFYFQLPWLPEWHVQRNEFAFWTDVMRESSATGTFSDEDLARYRAAWSREGATTAMINWYRALFQHSEDPPREQVDAPTLVVWGESDEYLLADMARESLEYCADGRLETFPDATHWVNHERSDRVLRLLEAHLEE